MFMVNSGIFFWKKKNQGYGLSLLGKNVRIDVCKRLQAWLLDKRLHARQLIRTRHLVGLDPVMDQHLPHFLLRKWHALADLDLWLSIHVLERRHVVVRQVVRHGWMRMLSFVFKKKTIFVFLCILSILNNSRAKNLLDFFLNNSCNRC